MKRAMVGGASRGPVGARRQRRTIRLVQVILVLISAGLLMFAGYSLGRARAVNSDDLTPPRPPGAAQTSVLFLLGVGTLLTSLALQGPGGVRLPTPARLRELETLGDGPTPIEEDEGSRADPQAPSDNRVEQTS